MQIPNIFVDFPFSLTHPFFLYVTKEKESAWSYFIIVFSPTELFIIFSLQKNLFLRNARNLMR